MITTTRRESARCSSTTVKSASRSGKWRRSDSGARVLMDQRNPGRRGPVAYGIEPVLDLEVAGELRARHTLAKRCRCLVRSLTRSDSYASHSSEKPSCLDIFETLVVRREVGDDSGGLWIALWITSAQSQTR
jgi:hypothetical protein